MGTPLVSILLPSLNARQFLDARIESILAQTFSDWEAIVLDSYSTDGSWEFFQSIASTDSRFRLYQIPREGVYAALNRGIELATGEFLHVATCDDTMVPEFLIALLELFAQCPEAGIAVCDVFLINRGGGKLTAKDMADHLPAESINDILSLSTVRYDYSGREHQGKLNYRPPPHDCLLHFSGKSVYFSLTQLLIRTSVAKAAEPFETRVGSISDIGWLLRLTNVAGTVHVPRKLTLWRFHGDQLSVHQDNSRLGLLKTMCERALPAIYERHYPLLTRNDCATLLLPCKDYLATSGSKRAWVRLEAAIRVLWMFVEKPAATLRAIHRTQFSVRTLKRTLVPMFLARLGLAPEGIDPDRTRRTVYSETSLDSGAFHEAEN